MIHWAKNKGEVKGIVRKTGQVKSVSLERLQLFVPGQLTLQDVQIMLDQLNGDNGVAFFGKSDTVSSGSRADFKDSLLLVASQGCVYIFQRSYKLNTAMLREQSSFFIVAVIIVFKIFHFCSYLALFDAQPGPFPVISYRPGRFKSGTGIKMVPITPFWAKV